MAKLIFSFFIFLGSILNVVFCQNKLSFDQLPVSTQNVFKQLVTKYRTGPVDYSTVKNDLKNTGIDFSKMSVEDAVVIMFMLISADAKKDMNEMLKEMDATRRKKEAIRQAEIVLKKQIDSLRKEARNKYDALDKKNNEMIAKKEIQLEQVRFQQKEITEAENKFNQSRKVAEKHLESVEQSRKNLLQQQSRKN